VIASHADVIAGMPLYVVERIELALKKEGKNLKGAKILVVGVTYKKDIKDLRQSPSLDMIGHLQPPAPG
jgi:UDP-N-acetyl-D-mannosaminuronate dehydrogenase